MAGKSGIGRINLEIGQRFCAWQVAGEAFRNKNTLWYPCICDCGTKKNITSQALREGKSRSCGCLKGKLSSDAQRKHGMSHTSAHNRWLSMKGRCLNESNRAFKDYGARGISVCERWMDFQNFYDDMGDPPSESHTLDRIDNDGNYSPENCRWASKEEQANNRRSNKRIEHAGITMTQRDWEKFLNIPEKRLHALLKKGVTMADVYSKYQD